MAPRVNIFGGEGEWTIPIAVGELESPPACIIVGSPMTLQEFDNSISTSVNLACSVGLLSSLALIVLTASVRELTTLVPGPLTQRAVNDR